MPILCECVFQQPKLLAQRRTAAIQPGIELPPTPRICLNAQYLRDPLQHCLRRMKDFSFLKVKVLTSAQHRDYLYAFLGKQDVKQAMGHLIPMAQGLLKILEGYRPQVQP